MISSSKERVTPLAFRTADYQALHLAGIRELQKGGQVPGEGVGVAGGVVLDYERRSIEGRHPVPCNRLSVPRFPPIMRPVA
jgi:hypothetical protein